MTSGFIFILLKIKNKYKMIAILFLFFSILIVYKLYILYKIELYSCLSSCNIEKPDQFLINLDKKPDRLKNSKCRLNKMGFYPTRFSAVNGRELDLNSIVHPSAMKSINKGYRLEHHELSVGAVGCAMSHFQLWNKLLASSYDKFYIFEDDTVPMFSMDVSNQYVLPDDWDIFLLGGLYNETEKVISDLFESSNLAVTRVYKFYCLHGYVIRNTANVKNILKQAFPISKQIDSWLSDLAFTNKINIYGVVNNRWVQTNEGTDIQTPVTQLFMNVL
jgi:GR25 family glycosyltransferase involved in LPS biosynthesis